MQEAMKRPAAILKIAKTRQSGQEFMTRPGIQGSQGRIGRAIASSGRELIHATAAEGRTSRQPGGNFSARAS
ncbi:MAG: hypothetical protein ABR601_02620 [Parasphingopyxis sp.]